jgi:hypothetical protein
MLFKKIVIIILISFSLSSVALASQSANYISVPNSVSSGGIKSSSSNNSNISSVGIASYSDTQSTNYISLNGFLVVLAGSGDMIPPSISNIKFDGRDVVKNDFIKSDALLTAILQDGSGISMDASGVVVDNTTTYLTNFVTPSTYDAATGNMNYNLNLSSGSHTIKILAVDMNANSTTYVQTLEVDTGELRAASSLVYPNPFNPNQGKAKFAYQLNRDGNVTLYLFNEINQLVWQRNFQAGSNGGQAGYNEIEWDGVTDFNEQVANGAYYLRVVSGGKVIGKTKVAVLK